MADERVGEGTPLLIPVMRQGVRLSAGRSDLAAARERARQQLGSAAPSLARASECKPAVRGALEQVSRSTESERLRAELAAKTFA